ncbi:HEAT repeat domain-containing protein [Paraburkholderia bannensis]|uniref:HEAT repeat domain-containing protein n=1 Tax=Paraburkholderia bannensis TaxID=765414 RepID=UPI002AB64241|nr:HEAT repeat domain-containing protein [Paraburkholderia bannensis]
MNMQSIAMEHAVIGPLVHRHAEDAAFYWSLLDTSVQSVKLDLDRLAHFQGMLEAHLEGLGVAGDEGWPRALSALEKWKKPGEAFACTWLAASRAEPQLSDALLEQLRRNPDSLLRGAISGLAWAAAQGRVNAIDEWLTPHRHPVEQVAALRAMALLDDKALREQRSAIPYLESPNAFVKAAACRAVAQAPHDCDAQLKALLADADPAVRAEAALALAAGGERRVVLPILWQCVARQAADAEALTGWYRTQATRRLNRWVRHLAALAPSGHSDLAELYRFLPPRVGLSFALYHGDPADLPYVMSRMAEPAHARYAGWVWQILTGIDLQSANLVRPEPPLQPDQLNVLGPERLDADRGLPLPDVEAIAHVQTTLSNRLVKGERILFGNVISEDALFAMLINAPQAVRSIAAQALRYAVPGCVLQVRGPVGIQKRVLQSWQERAAA